MSSFQRGCDADKLAYADSARNVYLWIERLMRALSDERVLVKSVTSGVRSVEYVFAMIDWLDKGASSVRRSYSPCKKES